MEKRNNSYSHILKYTSLFGGVQMLNILIGLVRNKLVAVLLGPAGMGLVALFLINDKARGGLNELRSPHQCREKHIHGIRQRRREVAQTRD